MHTAQVRSFIEFRGGCRVLLVDVRRPECSPQASVVFCIYFYYICLVCFILFNYFAELNVIIVFEFYCTFVCFFQSLSFFLSYFFLNYIPFNFTCFFFIIFPHCAILFCQLLFTCVATICV